MHFKIDEFRAETGLLQIIHPTVKLGFIILIPAVCAITPAEKISSSFLIFLLSLTLFKISKIPFRVFLKRMIPLIPFLLYPALLIFHAYAYGHNLFMPEQSALYNKFIDVFKHRIILPASEVSFALNLLIKSLATVNVVIVFTATTQFNALMGAFKTFMFPNFFILIFCSTWRYLETLVNEILTMTTAAKFKFFSPTNILSAKTFSIIFGSIFFRSIRRAEMNNISMKFRGYKTFSAVYALKGARPLTGLDAVFVVITIAFITFAYFLA